MLALSVNVYVMVVCVLLANKSPDWCVWSMVNAPELSVTTGSFQFTVVPELWKGTVTEILSGQFATIGGVMSAV